MKVDLFDYELPEERIAQRPLEDRTQSRLLVLDRASGTRTHSRFVELPSFLPPRSLLVLNDTSVIPARILGKRHDTGGRVEIFLLQRIGAESAPLAAATAGEPPWGRWTALLSPAKRMKPQMVIDLAHGATATIIGLAKDQPEGTWEVALEGTGPIAEGLASIGAPPLPPYIHRDTGPDAADLARYQTVFAAKPGAVAAPTAGLHFTPAFLDGLVAAGHEIAKVTLHVGAGTFLPVRVDDTQDHRMHKERYAISDATADAIARARRENRHVVAVGTTSLRTLESAARDGGTVAAGEGVTDLFCTPGFRFRVVDHLLTNFHQPRSTLVMLVAAFAGLDAIKTAYAEAVEKEYRFLSYGDAMFIR